MIGLVFAFLAGGVFVSLVAYVVEREPTPWSEDEWEASHVR